MAWGAGHAAESITPASHPALANPAGDRPKGVVGSLRYELPLNHNRTGLLRRAALALRAEVQPSWRAKSLSATEAPTRTSRLQLVSIARWDARLFLTGRRHLSELLAIRSDPVSVTHPEIANTFLARSQPTAHAKGET